MRKFKFFINFEKEEKWLHEMAKQGYQLEDKSFGYKFLSAEPEDTTIKVDYRVFKKQEDFIDYCTLFEDSGWKHISGKKSSGAQYFKKVDENSEEDIFSDNISKAGKYKRLSSMFVQMAFTFLPLLVALMTTDVIDLAAIVNPKLLYLTPGLWEKTGISFWMAFLFETPFALFRGIMWAFIPVMMTLYLIYSVKANILYQKSKKA
ncbi:DUF2812 domain-containing protein [Niallia endozanthoxylica]|uniref:DUF2812 domain-containing protein n=1 Tax=Niallia endozanthoxylica TaxID=2036016 RepID=A0A5J5HMP6_9BACI|nr:DUF2812 domain-containing protein [Niallia endozanthoxylica]KAA9021073.1 DUF2812 domain-containing protein [Niallia endozanthoxylica]